MAVAPDDPSFLQKLAGVLYPATQEGRQRNMDIGLSLLANSGYSTTPRTFGETLGGSVLQGQQMAVRRQQEQEEKEMNAIRKRYMEAQIGAMGAKPTGPASVQEYEYARQNGFKGSFQDWIVAGGQSSRPSSVQEWEFYSTLPPELQQRYLEMKRNPNMVVRDVGQVPTVVAPSVGFGTKQTPLSTLPQETSAASAMKQAESTGGKVGEALGNIQGGIQTKGANAVGTKALLDIAEPLIDVATGSATGAARDKVAAFFGEATTGSKAIAKLQVLQAGLMTAMPRMEGPQSDRDVQLYREAAGQIGDPKVPGPQKKAALQTIRQIQDKYIERAGGTSGPKYREGQTATNPKTGEKLIFRNGAWVRQ